MKKTRAALLIVSLCLGMSSVLRADGKAGRTTKADEVILGNDIGSPKITRLPNGTLLAVFSNKSRVCGVLSDDDGVTWGDVTVIKNSSIETGNEYEANPAACFTCENRVHVFYLRWVIWNRILGLFNCTLWKLESIDNGQTWTGDKRIDCGKHSYTLGSFGAIRMRNGTIIYPISWRNNGTIIMDYWGVSMLRSDDDGVTWIEGKAVPFPDEESTGLDEPSVVELTNGSLYCLFRTTLLGESKHLSSISNDCGITWSKPVRVREMYARDTTPAVIRYSWSPNVVLSAWINRTIDWPGLLTPGIYRRPLVVAVSENDGLSWNWIRVIDDGLNIGGEVNRSMNEVNFFVSDETIILGYRRYNDYEDFQHLDMINNSAITKKFTISFFYSVADLNHDGMIDNLDRVNFSMMFGTSNSEGDFNCDGTVDICDAILLAGHNNENQL